LIRSPRPLGSLAGAAALAALAFSRCAFAAENGPEDTIASLWRALSNAPGESADVAELGRLFHEDAVIFGARYKDAEPVVKRTFAGEFLESQRRVQSGGFHECEIARTVESYDRFATAYSIVESRTDPASKSPDFVGVNSLQLYRSNAGWKILSLYYHVEKKGFPIPSDRGASGKCIPRSGP